MKMKEEILQSEDTSELWNWIVQAKDIVPKEDVREVIDRFDKLRDKQFRDCIGPDFDPNVHYDFK